MRYLKDKLQHSVPQKEPPQPCNITMAASEHASASTSLSYAYEPPITFSTVIEDDHNTINVSAGRLLRAKSPADRARLLLEVTWRLVRHGVSEDLIMRPAFIEHFGEEGRHMAEHDRTDHDRAKTELLALFSVPTDSAGFLAVIGKFFAELLEHMKIESGEQIPALERILDPLESQRLGKEYVKTMALTPDLEIMGEDGVKRRVWNNVEDYVRTDLNRFKEIWDSLTAEQLMEAIRGYYKQYARGRL